MRDFRVSMDPVIADAFKKDFASVQSRYAIGEFSVAVANGQPAPKDASGSGSTGKKGSKSDAQGVSVGVSAVLGFLISLFF